VASAEGIASIEADESRVLSTFEHLAHGRSTAAFEELARLADAGHPEAARSAVLMATRGPRLFGQAFAASPSQRERWQHVANAVRATPPRPQ
jgi:hypothetical protein